MIFYFVRRIEMFKVIGLNVAFERDSFEFLMSNWEKQITKLWLR